ncbi:hypothetical protein HELRODRAFT_160198 [Helobdella robusta]|uniref:Uncharacterized protein n=1 Tax=Helobdella robusta TaxID=6412 RepID=T1EPY5_HELRO|nr:hypothetical protein HELRODRAFT_160198 [Helobdella robusta]ESO06068.1 hypothetical protein HELRODRAFT_160198 [Helobdella robusta]
MTQLANGYLNIPLSMTKQEQMLIREINKNVNLSNEKKVEFLQQSEFLFDICSCKCKILGQCSCVREVKIPKEEHEFLIDQRGERKMRIGGIDRNRTKNLQKKLARKSASTNKCQRSDTNNTQYKMPEKILISSINSDSDTNILFAEKKSLSTSETMENKKYIKGLPLLSQVCDRYGVSERAGAAIASAVLHELLSDVVIDKSKLRRERKKTREVFMQNEIHLNLPALNFDERKDKTLRIVTNGIKKYRQVVIEEHVSIIKEPDSIYLGYVTPSQGTAESIEMSINALLSAKNIGTDDLLLDAMEQ